MRTMYFFLVSLIISFFLLFIKFFFLSLSHAIYKFYRLFLKFQDITFFNGEENFFSSFLTWEKKFGFFSFRFYVSLVLD